MTADDFGLSIEVNEAIEQAFCSGVLRTTSILLAAPAAEDALARARRIPGFSIGLHIAVVRAPSFTRPGQKLDEDLVGPSFSWALSPRARRAMEAEIIAQFEAFDKTGLECDHVNTHNHMHLHPFVLDCIIGQMKRYSIERLRLPLEPPLVAAGLGGRLLRWWSRRIVRKAASYGIRTNDYVFGLHHTGRMTKKRLLSLITQAEALDGVGEIYFHPATKMTESLTAFWGKDYRGDDELAALLDDEVGDALDKAGLKACDYRQALAAT